MSRRFVCYFHLVGWDCLSLGAHVCIGLPNLEFHLPFGFLRIGWQKVPDDYPSRWKLGRTIGWSF